MDFARLPGGELIRQGLEDLAAGRESEAALLVLVGAPRLQGLGVAVPRGAGGEAARGSPEHRLYERLAADEPDTAHSRYNALVRLLMSFERAAACAA
jgi:hypothetical protein